MFLEAGDLEAMVKNKTYLVPTMSVWDAMLYYARAVDCPRLVRSELRIYDRDHVQQSQPQSK